MRIGLSTDWHICQFSSLVRGMGEKHSVRLEHLIDSINWAERVFEEKDCYAHICLGDAFDKPDLNAAEISALNDIEWGNLLHYFIVGNHEMASSDLRTNSANLFDLLPNCTVIANPTMLFGNIFALPYVLEKNRKPLKEYLVNFGRPRVILSHNDIAGMQMGQFISKEGFSVDEIEESCDLFLNGHLHNMGQFAKNGWNIGNLCGQNFSEDAFNYQHLVWVLDTDNGSIETFENPYALNFYKLSFTDENEEQIRWAIGSLKNNAVLTVRCKQGKHDLIKKIVSERSDIIESRFILDYDTEVCQQDISQTLTVDHLAQFEKYVKEHIGYTDLIAGELKEVMK